MFERTISDDGPFFLKVFLSTFSFRKTAFFCFFLFILRCLHVFDAC